MKISAKKVLVSLGKGLKSVKKWWISLHLGRVFGLFYEDILIFSGLFFIIFATFLINKIAGFYCLGGCLLGLGAYFTKYPIKRGR